MRPVGTLLLFALLAPATARGGVPRIEISSQASAPQRPMLTVVADEALEALEIALTPRRAAAGQPGAESPETQGQRLRVARLRAGERRSFPIGTGLVGRTAWVGAAQYRSGGQPGRLDLSFETLVVPELKVRYDREHLDLAARWVAVQLSRPAGHAEVKVIGEDGAEIGAGQASWRGAAAGTWLRVPWEQKAAGNVLRLELTLSDQAGFPVRLTLWPWSVTVPHEEVRFATGSSEIRPEERGKLDESHRRIAAILEKVRDKLQPPQRAQLFVAGHTDTVDSDAYNLRLSQERARAIAGYLAGKGLAAPVHFAGCGERALKVKTPDNVDEERNRRVDYVLSIDPPRLACGAAWQPLK